MHVEKISPRLNPGNKSVVFAQRREPRVRGKKIAGVFTTRGEKRTIIVYTTKRGERRRWSRRENNSERSILQCKVSAAFGYSGELPGHTMRKEEKVWQTTRGEERDDEYEERKKWLKFRLTRMTMTTSLAAKPARGRGPPDGRAFFERLWRGNFLLDRQRVFKRSRKRKLQASAGGRKISQASIKQQHCCCCQRIQFHLLAGRRNNLRSVVRWIYHSYLLSSTVSCSRTFRTIEQAKNKKESFRLPFFLPLSRVRAWMYERKGCWKTRTAGIVLIGNEQQWAGFTRRGEFSLRLCSTNVLARSRCFSWIQRGLTPLLCTAQCALCHLRGIFFNIVTILASF